MDDSSTECYFYVLDCRKNQRTKFTVEDISISSKSENCYFVQIYVILYSVPSVVGSSQNENSLQNEEIL